MNSNQVGMESINSKTAICSALSYLFVSRTSKSVRDYDSSHGDVTRKTTYTQKQPDIVLTTLYLPEKQEPVL